jgi:hypothetical protein
MHENALEDLNASFSDSTKLGRWSFEGYSNILTVEAPAEA